MTSPGENWKKDNESWQIRFGESFFLAGRFLEGSTSCKPRFALQNTTVVSSQAAMSAVYPEPSRAAGL